MADPPVEIHAQRGRLLRIAMLLLHDRDQAEAIVQETLLAALEAGEKSTDQSSARTSLIEILRQKFVDANRRRSFEAPPTALGDEAEPDDLDVFFTGSERDQWMSRPAEWRNPERDLEQPQFIGIIDFCLEKLPPATARVFLLREVMEMKPAEICRELRITVARLSLVLYRGRMLLRECLEQRWFADTSTSG